MPGIPAHRPGWVSGSMGSASLADVRQGKGIGSKRKEVPGSPSKLDLDSASKLAPGRVNFFITGTDTGVGKTYVTKLMIEALRSEGRASAGFKPVSCGDREDALILAAASGDVPLDEVNPLHFNSGLAPHVAALLENKRIDPADLTASYHAFAARFQDVLVEGAGGWEVPITESYFISDLAKDLGLPVILVAANRLGALNHILLTIAAIRAKGLTCTGIVLNQLGDEMDTPMITNKGILESLTDVPLLDHIIHGQDFISQELMDVLLGETASERG